MCEKTGKNQKNLQCKKMCIRDRGTKIVVTGRIQTGSYTNKDGQRVYTTDVVVEEQELSLIHILGVGYLRGAVLSTRGPGWTDLWCTGCIAKCIAG